MTPSVLFMVVSAAVPTPAPPPPPPVLPTMWTAETIDPPMGDGIEAYNFVSVPSEDNPSSLWSNYTGCQRLIRVWNLAVSDRYLLKCDALDCCVEDQSGQQVEFQIPNVYPSTLAPVTHVGRKNITNFGEKVEADEWSWSYSLGAYKAYTNPCSDCVNNVTLVQWHVSTIAGVSAKIQFKNYRGVKEADAAAFKASFDVPPECKGNVLSCNQAHERGLLSTERLGLLRKDRW